MVVHDQRARGAAEAFAAHGAGRDLRVVRLEVPDRLKNAFAARDLRRSDHAPFWRRDVPAMMLTDTANFDLSSHDDAHKIYLHGVNQGDHVDMIVGNYTGMHEARMFTFYTQL